MGEAIRKLGNTEVEALARIVAESGTPAMKVQNGKGFTILFYHSRKGTDHQMLF